MKKKIKFSIGTLVIIIAFVSCSKKETPDPIITTPPSETVRVDSNIYISDGVETFTFFTDGVETEGLIYLPEAYETNNNLPVIYLIDYMEHGVYTVITDEFAQLINAVREIPNFDALVVSLKTLPDIYTYPPFQFQVCSDIIKDMSFHVDSIYSENSSKTLIGRGVEGGVVLLTLLNEDPEENVFENYIVTDSPYYYNNAAIDLNQSDTIPSTMLNKKLHFSYSSSNNQGICAALTNSFEEAQYPWLTYESEYYFGEFVNVYPEAFAAGLHFVFE